MRIIIDIDNYNSDFDYIIDYIANSLKNGNSHGCAETDGCLFEWSTEKDNEVM